MDRVPAVNRVFAGSSRFASRKDKSLKCLLISIHPISALAATGEEPLKIRGAAFANWWRTGETVCFQAEQKIPGDNSIQVKVTEKFSSEISPLFGMSPHFSRLREFLPLSRLIGFRSIRVHYIDFLGRDLPLSRRLTATRRPGEMKDHFPVT